MTTTMESRIAGYLGRVRVALRGIPEREIEDTLRELHSHIADLQVFVGWALKVVTDRIAQWWIRRYRRSKASQEA